MHSHNDEDMLKVGANGPGSEGVCSRFLEHNGHNVVPNVALPQQLENRILCRELLSSIVNVKSKQGFGIFVLMDPEKRRNEAKAR